MGVTTVYMRATVMPLSMKLLNVEKRYCPNIDPQYRDTTEMGATRGQCFADPLG